jgi:choice-of-anchor C domain-containing protein
MNYKNFRTLVACAAFVSTTLLTEFCAAGPNLLINGDFEDPPVGITPSGDGVTVIPSGSTALPGWTATGDSIDHLGNNYWQNASGASSVDLDGFFAAGGVRQTFATEIGKTYRLSFAHAGNPDFSDEPLKKLQATIAGVSQQYAFDVTGRTHDNMGWVYESLIFVADSALSTLELTSLDLGTHGRGPTVDNVAVSVVPEPSATLLGGSAAIVCMWRRRSRTSDCRLRSR